MLKRPRDANKGTGPAWRRAPKQEKALARSLPGSRVTKASGAQKEKGDVRFAGVCRIECKATCNKSYSLTRETFYKLATASAGAKEIPAIIIEFLNERGGVECDLAIIPVEALTHLIANASA